MRAECLLRRTIRRSSVIGLAILLLMPLPRTARGEGTVGGGLQTERLRLIVETDAGGDPDDGT